MPRVDREIDIGAPVESVFAFMSNPVNLQLYPGISEVRELAGEGLGRHWREAYKLGGMEVQEECAVVEFDRNHREVLESHSPLESTWTEEFDPEDSGTHLHFTLEWKIPDFLPDEAALYDLDDLTRHAVDDYLHRVKDSLESIMSYRA